MHSAATNHPCPRDGHPLTSVTDQGIRMESCHSCGGLWVPMAHLLPRLSSRACALLFHADGGRQTQMRCPIDGAAMHEFDVSSIHIDRCESCRGLWFDPGELTTVLAITGPAPTKKSDLDQWGETTDTGAIIVDNVLHGTDILSDGADVVGEVLSAIAEFIGGAISL